LIKIYKERGTVEPKPVFRRPKILSSRDVKSLKRVVKKNRRASLKDKFITNHCPRKFVKRLSEGLYMAEAYSAV
ncbi:hypothetical protein BGX20_004982, partial [Mortierella sp. AD010]